MSETLKIRLAARSDAAGRPENEDNFHVVEDLSTSNIGFTKDKVFSLGSKGTLLLVCDGMGGMNAGEVASDVGVKTIKDLFAPQLLTSDIFANDDSICMYMKRAIIKADSRIKEEASKDEAKRGMGSTAVMAWLYGQKVYVAWCGDSRCYRYNPAKGLEQLSHDHSYVQDLVDTGQLSPDLAFDHPNKNIITRSLGDPRGAAKPDAKVYDLCIGDVILLCSDGLSDSLRDSEIEQSISRSLSSMVMCLETLWNDSKQAGWHDNVTILLAQVLDDNIVQVKPQTSQQTQSDVTQQDQKQPQIPRQEIIPPKIMADSIDSTSPIVPDRKPWYKKSGVIAAIITLILVLCSCLCWHYSVSAKHNEEYDQLYKSIDVNFNIEANSTEKKIKEAVDKYKQLVELEKNGDIKNCRSGELKNNINKGIQNRQIQLRNGTSEEIAVADQINKYKIE